MERINIYVSQRVADEIEVFLSIFGTPEHKGMTGENMKECFGTDDMNRISSLGFDVMTEKYQEWKRRKAEIHIGDEVESVISHDTFVVTRIKNDTISGFDGTGTLSSCLKNSLRKTGRHFPEVAALLKDISNDSKGRSAAAPKKQEDRPASAEKICDKCRKHTENVIDDLEARIKNEIRELRENGERHADFVQANAELIISGMKSAMTIVEEVRKKENG